VENMILTTTLIILGSVRLFGIIVFLYQQKKEDRYFVLSLAWLVYASGPFLSY
jgi:hypothetical protein